MYLIGRIGDKEIRVLAKDGSVIVQGVESVEKHTLQDDKKEVSSVQQEETSNGQQISPSNSSRSQEPGGSVRLDQSQDSQTGLSGIIHQQGDLLQMGAEGQVADKSGGSAAEAGSASQGLCAAGTDEPEDGTVKTGDTKPKEGEQTTAQNQ
jgi:hypothetical protein